MTSQWWMFTGLLGVVIALDLWQRRLDRRRIADLDRQLLRALGIIGEKNDEIVRLESVVVDLDDRNERLHADLKAMRERLPRMAMRGPIGADQLNADPDPLRPYIPTYEEEQR